MTFNNIPLKKCHSSLEVMLFAANRVFSSSFLGISSSIFSRDKRYFGVLEQNAKETWPCLSNFFLIIHNSEGDCNKLAHNT